MFTLRPARPDDLSYLAALERQVMEPHARALWGAFHPAEFSLFDLSNTRLVLDGAKPAGFVMVERGSDHLRLRKIYLDPAHQGQGWGKALLARIRAEAAGAGLPLRLSVLRPNQRALAFYLREGMRPVDATAERILLEAAPAEARA